MEIKILLCNCKGLCDSFKEADMNTLPFNVESDLDVQYTIAHPQLCGLGGNKALEDVLRQSAMDPETYVVVGACAPNAQAKLFRKVLRDTGFDERRFVPLDIRGTTNDGIVERLRTAVEPLLGHSSAGSKTPAIV